MLCMSIHGVRMFIESIFSTEDNMAKKEDREGSHQEGGKEDFEEKEVISSTTNRLPPPGPLEASEASPRDLKSRLRPSKRRGNR
jgi:hypothetical protein